MIRSPRKKIQLLFPYTFDFHILEDSFILTNILTIEYSPFGGSWLGDPFLSLAKEASEPFFASRMWNVLRNVIRNWRDIRLYSRKFTWTNLVNLNLYIYI